MNWLKRFWNWLFPPVKPISEQPEPEEVEDKAKQGSSRPIKATKN